MQNLIAKTAGVVVAIALFVGVAVPAANALTSSELVELLISLGIISGENADAARTALGTTTGSSSSSACAAYTRDLTIGATGTDVVNLQEVLIDLGYLNIPVGVSKGYFGSLTQSALAQMQAAEGISPPAGYFGPITRSAFAGLCAASNNSSDDDSDDDMDDDNDSGLQGGAGSVDSYDNDSSYNNEEVGEGQEDVEVAGIEIEADNESDLEITALTIDFNPGTGVGTNDLDDYADEVSVWFNGEEVARLDADEFEDDDSYQQTVSLDSGVIVKAGDEETIIIAVSGLNNIDSSDEGDEWDVDVEKVRFRDAQNAVISDDTDSQFVAETFSFESFSSSADIDFQVTKGDDNVNDSQTIQVDDNDDTEGVEVLSFEVEVGGDSDILVDDLSINFATTGASLSQIANSAELFVDGDSVGSESITASNNSLGYVLFDNLDLEFKAGDTAEVIVELDFNDAAATTNQSGFDNGDTLTISVDPEDVTWDIEDEEGDSLLTSDISGAASSDAHKFFVSGVIITDFNPGTPSVKDTTETAGGEEGTFALTFMVQAFEDDIYIPKGAVVGNVLSATKGISYNVLDGNGDVVATTTNHNVTTDADVSGDYYVVEQGEGPVEFTLNVTVDPETGDFYSIQLEGISYKASVAEDADTFQNATPEENYDTASVDIDA